MDKCILIYDDNMEILFLCKSILRKTDYRVETRSRCETVIEDVASLRPDLILMDLWIPEIGGEKAVTILKHDPATAHVPILLFSANAEIKDIAEKVKADGYIEKPFDVLGFKAQIAKALQGASAGK